MTRGRTEPAETDQGWTVEERRAITVLLSRGLISSSVPITRSGEPVARQRRRAG